jgi:hypothetical protein
MVISECQFYDLTPLIPLSVDGEGERVERGAPPLFASYFPGEACLDKEQVND